MKEISYLRFEFSDHGEPGGVHHLPVEMGLDGSWPTIEDLPNDITWREVGPGTVLTISEIESISDAEGYIGHKASMLVDDECEYRDKINGSKCQDTADGWLVSPSGKPIARSCEYHAKRIVDEYDASSIAECQGWTFQAGKVAVDRSTGNIVRYLPTPADVEAS